MNIDWKEIKEKYPKAFNLFIFSYIYPSAKDIHKDGNLIIDGKIEFNYYKLFLKDDCRDICYCDFEKFFAENNWFKEYFRLITAYSCMYTDFNYDIYKKSRDKAIMTIFEKIEEQLNNK